MSRAEPARLADLEDVLGEVRSWSRVQDRGGGTFYVGRRPLLHFHVRNHGRRADVRGADGWLQIQLPEPAPAPLKRRLLRVVRAAYAGS